MSIRNIWSLAVVSTARHAGRLRLAILFIVTIVALIGVLGGVVGRVG